MNLAYKEFRIMLVEDEAMIAMFLEDVLQNAGFEVVGPIGRVEAGIEAAKNEPMLDAALLDVNLGRTTVFPIADQLILRNIPMVFMTGYGADGLPERFADRPVVTKPYTPEIILGALAKVLTHETHREQKAM